MDKSHEKLIVSDDLKNLRTTELNSAKIYLEEAMRSFFTSFQLSTSPSIEQQPVVKAVNASFNSNSEPGSPAGNVQPTAASAKVENPTTYFAPTEAVGDFVWRARQQVTEALNQNGQLNA